MEWINEVLGEEWFAGFVSGVVATFLGFLFTILWDIAKAQRDTKERDGTIFNAIGEELIANKKSLDHNLTLIQAELSVLAEKKTVVSPLLLFDVGFWDIAKINLPKKFRKGKGLSILRKVSFLFEQTNKKIRSRENYRIHNGTMSNFEERMQIYDESLMHLFDSLSYEMALFENEMNSHKNFFAFLSKFKKRLGRKNKK